MGYIYLTAELHQLKGFLSSGVGRGRRGGGGGGREGGWFWTLLWFTNTTYDNDNNRDNPIEINAKFLTDFPLSLMR